MKTMKLWRILPAMAIVLFVAFSLASCDKTEKDGDWDPMIWKADTPAQKTDGAWIVSPDGGTLAFSCSNYSKPWFSSADEDGESHLPPYINNLAYPKLSGTHFKAEIHDNKLTIVFEPNADAAVRKTSITVTAGDIFYTFKFRQDAKQ